MNPLTASSRVWRWLTLLAIVCNVLCNFLYTRLGSPDLATVTDNYPTLFRPAGYTFSAWGLIYLAFLVYGVIQLLPTKRYVRLYDELCVPLIIVNLLGILWIMVYTKLLIPFSLFVIACMLIGAFYLFFKVNRAVNQLRLSAWAELPFSLLAGWLTAATIANLFVYLSYHEWDGGQLGESTWTMLMLGFAGLTGIVIGIARGSFAYPAMLAWALMGVYMEHRLYGTRIANVASLSALCSAAVSIVMGLRLIRIRKHAHF